MNPLAMAAGAGALASAILYGLWQHELAVSARKDGIIEGLQTSLATETSRADAEATNGKRMFDMTNAAQARVTTLDGKLATATQDKQEAVAKLEAMKATELNNAIEEPFERGNAASDRRYDSVCKLLAKTDGLCAGSVDPKGDGTDNQE